MKKCSIYKVRKNEKTYFKGAIEYADGKVFDFALTPKFLTKKQYLFLLEICDENPKE